MCECVCVCGSTCRISFPPDLHVAPSALMRSAVVAAVLAHGHLLGFAVVKAVGVVLRAAPGPRRPPPQEVPAQAVEGCCKVRLHVGLAAGRLAAQADLLRGRRGPRPEHAVQRRRRLLHVQGVELTMLVGFRFFSRPGFWL